MRKFRPQPQLKAEKRNIKIELSPAEYDNVKQRAEKAGISMKEYVRQALWFAMEYDEEEAE